MNAVVKKLVLSREMAASGVDYSSRHGALCPWCGERTKISSTRAWEDSTRVRYHRCDNGRCPLSTLRIYIKSIEVDHES